MITSSSRFIAQHEASDIEQKFESFRGIYLTGFHQLRSDFARTNFNLAGFISL